MVRIKFVPLEFQNSILASIHARVFSWLLLCVFNTRYPRLAPKHAEANTAGIDVFAKFSAYIKNPRKDTNDGKRESIKECQHANIYKLVHNLRYSWFQLERQYYNRYLVLNDFSRCTSTCSLRESLAEVSPTSWWLPEDPATWWDRCWCLRRPARVLPELPRRVWAHPGRLQPAA